MRYVKVKVACLDKQMEKNVNKTFFVDAVSFADAEKKVYESVASLFPGSQANVKSMGYVQFSECKLTQNDGDFYKVTLCMVFDDENTGRRKKTKYTMLVEAMDTKDAHFIVESELRDDEILKIEKLDVEDVIS